MCWILGRLSFEKHVEPDALFDSVEKERGITIICIVMSKTWYKIPDIYSKRKNAYLCRDFDEVSIFNDLKCYFHHAFKPSKPLVELKIESLL